MSYHLVTHHVETSIPVIAGEWTITARVYLCNPNDRHDCSKVDEWLTATYEPVYGESPCLLCGPRCFASCRNYRAPASMDAEEFLATATDIDRQKLTDAVIQQAIDNDEHPSIARGDYEYDRRKDERMEGGR